MKRICKLADFLNTLGNHSKRNQVKDHEDRIGDCREADPGGGGCHDTEGGGPDAIIII